MSYFEKKYNEEGLLKELLNVLYCEGIPNTLGLDIMSIDGYQLGIVQRVLENNGINNDHAQYQNIPRMIKLIYHVKTDLNSYTIIRQPTSNDISMKDKCSLEIAPIN